MGRPLATFSDGTVDYRRATFSDGTVTFSEARFSGGTVYFGGATLAGGTIDFRGATFSSGSVYFREVRFSGGTVKPRWGEVHRRLSRLLSSHWLGADWPGSAKRAPSAGWAVPASPLVATGQAWPTGRRAKLSADTAPGVDLSWPGRRCGPARVRRNAVTPEALHCGGDVIRCRGTRGLTGTGRDSTRTIQSQKVPEGPDAGSTQQSGPSAVPQSRARPSKKRSGSLLG
jgi:hypothetical protein